MKRKPSAPFVIGVALILLQLLSFAGQLKGGNSILPHPSGPLGRIHPYDLLVFLVSVLPGVAGVVLVVCSKGHKQSEVEQDNSPQCEGQDVTLHLMPRRSFLKRAVPMWLTFILSAALVGTLFLVLWQRYYLPIQFTENVMPLIAEKEAAARKAGRDAGYEDGYAAGHDDGEAAGYADGYAQGKLVYYWEVSFFRRGACIVTEAGEKYHHYDCYHVRNRTYWIYNVELAEAKGYTPCLDCWEQGINSLMLPPLS